MLRLFLHDSPLAQQQLARAQVRGLRCADHRAHNGDLVIDAYNSHLAQLRDLAACVTFQSQGEAPTLVLLPDTEIDALCTT